MNPPPNLGAEEAQASPSRGRARAPVNALQKPRGAARENTVQFAFCPKGKVTLSDEAAHTLGKKPAARASAPLLRTDMRAGGAAVAVGGKGSPAARSAAEPRTARAEPRGDDLPL